MTASCGNLHVNIWTDPNPDGESVSNNVPAQQAPDPTPFEDKAQVSQVEQDPVGSDPTEPEAAPKETSVYLNGMDYFDLRGSISTGGEKKDNLGNQYARSYELGGYGTVNTNLYATYYLGGNYSTFSGVCAVPFNNRDLDSSSYFEVYGDDVLLFTSDVMTHGSLIQPFSIDISGVTVLKISYPDGGGMLGSMSVIFDGVLTRTAS